MHTIPARSGKIISVNTSSQKGMCKMPVDEIIVDALGMQGDSHAGAWNRQISLLSSESILRFQEKTAVPLTYGSFAEKSDNSRLIYS